MEVQEHTFATDNTGRMTILINPELRNLKELLCALQEAVGAYQCLKRLGSDWCLGGRDNGVLLVRSRKEWNLKGRDAVQCQKSDR